MSPPLPDRLGDPVQVRGVLDADLDRRRDRRVGHDGLRDACLRVLLLRVLQVPGVADLRLVAHGLEPLVDRRLRLVHQPVRQVELAAVDRADRVRARADRRPGGRQRPLAGSHPLGEAGVDVLGDAVEIHRPRLDAGDAGLVGRTDDDVHQVVPECREAVVGGTGRPAAGVRRVPVPRRPGRSGCAASRVRAICRAAAPLERIDTRSQQYTPRSTTSTAVAYHIGRSGGTIAMSPVSTMHSISTMKTRRRRSRALAWARAFGPMKAIPLRVTIQRPCPFESASRSMFRSKSFTLFLGAFPKDGRRKTAHKVTRTASNSQPTRQPSRFGSPVRHKMLGWVGKLAPEIWWFKHQR